MNPKIKITLYILATIVIVWTLISIFVQVKSSKEKFITLNAEGKKQALIVYDPDPFYNFDEQISQAIAEGLSQHDWKTTISTVAAALKEDTENYRLYVFCSNTYNFAPDRAISDFIINHTDLENKATVAVSLGGGSTELAHRILKQKITEQKNGQLIDDASFWLMRPNDDSRLEESNIQVALEKASKFGENIGIKMNNFPAETSEE